MAKKPRMTDSKGNPIPGSDKSKTGSTSAATAKENERRKRESQHAPWKARYTKETGKSADGIKQKAAYNTWLAAKRKARAAKAKPGAIATVAAKAKGGK